MITSANQFNVHFFTKESLISTLRYPGDTGRFYISKNKTEKTDKLLKKIL